MARLDNRARVFRFRLILLETTGMKPLKILLLIAILACTPPVFGGCVTEEEPTVEQAQVVTAPQETFATPAAVETATVAQPLEQASPMAEATPGAGVQSPQPPYASVESTTEENSSGALSTIGNILAAPFRLLASAVGFML
jgi:hypothetical protein